MELKQRAYLLIMLSVIWASLQPIFLSYARGAGMNTFFLLVYATSIVASLLFVTYKKKLPDLRNVLSDKKNIAILFIIGLVLFVPTEYGVTYAENYVSASLVAVMLRTSPLLMLILLPTVLRERLSKYQIAALSVGFVGIFIAASAGNPLGIFQSSSIGIVGLLALLAFVYSFSVILIRKYVFDISVILFGAAIAMFLLVGAITAVEGTGLQALSAAQIGIALLMGISYNVINYAIFYTFARQVKATVASNVLAFSPFLTFIFAGVILGQPVYLYYVVVALLAIVGIALQSFDKIGGSYMTKSNDDRLGKITIFDVTGIFANTGEIAINNTIRQGGRILAVKFDSQHTQRINEAILGPDGAGVYTSSHAPISAETSFVKDILGANSSELVVMKAGKIDECEKFFQDLYGKIFES